MAKFTKFDKRECQEIRVLINKKLAELSTYGVDIKLLNIKYSEFEFKASIEAKIVGKEEDSQAQKTQAAMWGYSDNEKAILNRNWGKKFIEPGTSKTMILVGLDPKKPKNCVILKGIDGTSYRASKKYLDSLIAKKIIK
jgi:hypothetical protein